MLYWIISAKFRNGLLLIASYSFYMSWNPVYACLIFITSFSTWGCALLVEKGRKREVFLNAAIIINLAILFTFKYYDFLCALFNDIFGALGVSLNHQSLGLVLPVGISFYTFQSIGYIVDVYRKNVPAEKDFFLYALFISFFPQLVAGPIERTANLLPQFKERKTFSLASFEYGLMTIIWGMFMKLCLADRCGIYVDAIYDNLEHHNGGSYLLASLFFSFQIYGDFCGYSLIAIGCAKMLGFNMMKNFNHPFLSTSIRDFWRRWHISLSTWFRDYVYIPLGGNICSVGRMRINLLITMLLSGLWHGASWNFVVWGGLHGMALCIESLFAKSKTDRNGSLFVRIVKVVFTFCLVSVLFIFFRAKSLHDATYIISGIFTDIGVPFRFFTHMVAIAVAVTMVALYEILHDNGITLSLVRNPKVRYILTCTFCITMTCYILLFGVLNGDQFIYFQF